jgi:hypothetical protein
LQKFHAILTHFLSNEQIDDLLLARIFDWIFPASQLKSKTDRIAFREGFCSLDVQQDNISDCPRTIFLPAPTPQSNNQKLIAS